MSAKKGYYSSAEKDAVRTYFDTPLIRYMRAKAKAKLAYFGLPGDDARDVREWRSDLRYVAAVERRPKAVAAIEKVFETQLPDLQFRVHLGEADKIIAANKGNRRMVGGQSDRPFVSTVYKEEIAGYVWSFDVVNLDYYGSFLPLPIAGPANDRANAIRTLFESGRQDSWCPWLLMITTEADYAGKDDRKHLGEYLTSAKKDCSDEVVGIIDGLLATGGADEAPMLIHGAASLLIAGCASAANLRARPRGTVLYPGANGQPMIHMAYEFEPTRTPLAAPVERAELLRAPILTTSDPIAEPWLKLGTVQVQGLTNEMSAQCLDFLEQGARDAIVSVP